MRIGLGRAAGLVGIKITRTRSCLSGGRIKAKQTKGESYELGRKRIKKGEAEKED